MEENGKEECCIWSGIGDIAERQVEVKFLNASEESNDTSHHRSDIFDDRSCCLTEEPVNIKTTVKRSSSEKSVEELANLLRNHYLQNNVKDKAEIVKEELDQACPSDIPCAGNVALANSIETISVEKKENITLKKEGGNGEPVYDSVNLEIECASFVLKTNESHNHFINTCSADLTKNTLDSNVEIDAPERNDSLDNGFQVAPGEFQETCKFCTKHANKINFEPSGVATKDLNSEETETASTQEISCSFCLSKSNYKRKYCRDSKSEIDLLRPASRISDKSSNSNISGNSETRKKNKKEFVLETDPSILSRRQKQIEYGKNTTGYQRYKTMIPKDRRTRQDPQTPPKCAKYSRRAWDGLIKTWRRKLHNWDPQKHEESDDEILSVVSSSSFYTASDNSENLNDAASDLVEEEQTFAVERETNDISNSEDADSLQAKET